MSTNLIPLKIIARQLGIPPKWLANEAKAGRLTSLNAGGTVFFDKPVLLAELSSRAGQGKEPVAKRTILGGVG